MSATAYDTRACALGEGVLWHPERQQLFWFDILGNKLLSRSGDEPLEWQFKEHVSAAGWIDQDTLLVASETALMTFDIPTGRSNPLIDLEADNPITRSNDGRADPKGGFWIGTMGKNAETGAGSIYRFYKGALELLFQDITITNAICFSPDGSTAYFTDTRTGVILQQALDAEGWPVGPATTFVDLTSEGLNPDGAIVDAEGCLWNAQWGAGRVARYAPNGELLETVAVPAQQASCPGFGGPDLKTLFVTTAAIDAAPEDTAAGQTFACKTAFKGQREYKVIL